MRRQRHCRLVFPGSEVKRSRRHDVPGWQFTAQDDEYLEPARYQYREAFILVDAMYRDEPVMWCPYIYVDNDAALARGWTQGFPKKMGSIFQTRSFGCQVPPRRRLRLQQVWRQSFGAWPTSLRKPASPCNQGRSRTECLSSATHGLAAILSETGGRIPGQAGGKRTRDVDHRQSHGYRRMGREGRT